MATHSSRPFRMKSSNLQAWTADRMRDAMPTAVMKLQEDCGPHSSMMKRCFDTVMFSFCHIPRVKSKHFPRKSSVFSERGTTATKPNTNANKYRMHCANIQLSIAIFHFCCGASLPRAVALQLRSSTLQQMRTARHSKDLMAFI